MESLGAPMRKILVLMRAIFISGIPYDPVLKGCEKMRINCENHPLRNWLLTTLSRKNGGVEVLIKTKTLLSNAADPNRNFLRAV